MPLPDRPVSLTTIDSEWGQAVHDWTFAPKGCEVYSTTTSTVSTTASKLNMDLVGDDPGGFLDAANDQVVVPSDGDGLYLIFVLVNSVNGATTVVSRAYLYLNGTPYANSLEDSEGGTNVRITIGTLIPLTAGDILTVYGQKKNSGTSPDMKVLALRMIRVGNEYGA